MEWLKRLDIAQSFRVVLCCNEPECTSLIAGSACWACPRWGDERADALFVGHSGRDLAGPRSVGLVTGAFRLGGRGGDCAPSPVDRFVSYIPPSATADNPLRGVSIAH